MKQRKGPYPSPAAMKQFASNQIPALQASVSGEISASKTSIPMGAVNIRGRVQAAFLSFGDCGRDDSDDLYVELNVKINGTTCMTTKPKVPANDGSASEQKTTKVTGDTGIVQGVVNASANSVSPGDVVTVDFELTRVSPDTEMANCFAVVEVEPVT